MAAASADPLSVRGATRARGSDGRWHFQHGPIDLVIAAQGEPVAVAAALERAWVRFTGVLDELVQELALLRSPVQEAGALRGPIARRMLLACWPHRDRFITPMAAVAGAVADDLIGAFAQDPRIAKAYVNNGGDIAIHLAPGEHLRLGIAAIEDASLRGRTEIAASDPVRGIATSGWRGRSFSLGIADSVTVLARKAAEADAAATMIANATDADDPAIERRPANALRADTDLGSLAVTVEVGELRPASIERALDAGSRHAQALCDATIIHAAVIRLKGSTRVVGGCPLPMQTA